MADWVRSQKWAPADPGGGSGGFSVENPETGEAGHGKPIRQAQEVLGYLLSQEVGVAVPETVLGTHQGQTIAISKSWGPVSLDVPKARSAAQDAESAQALAAALQAASGLLIYHAWLGTGDHKDQHLVVRPGKKKNQFEVASIDFAIGSFEWPENGGAVSAATGPPALLSNRDPQVVAKILQCIEALHDERIAAIVNSLPDNVLSPSEKARISKGLAVRKGQLRSAAQAAGWL